MDIKTKINPHLFRGNITKQFDEEHDISNVKLKKGPSSMYSELHADEDTTDILSLLDQDNLEDIKRDFKKNENNGLSLKEFVMVMLHHLPEARDKISLVQNLIELFAQIDVNGDETMEWEEFTNHIIELGMIRKDRTFIDAIKDYMLSNVRDKEKHETEVEHIYYFDKLKNFLIMERDKKKFKVYNSKNGKCTSYVSGHTGAVIGADYIDDEDHKLIVTSANDNSLNLWDAQNYIFRDRISTPEIQMTGNACIFILNKVKWSPECKLLFSGGCDAVIHAYDIKKLKEKHRTEGFNPLKKNSKEGHQGQVLDLLTIPKQSILVSAGMDAQICLWSFKDLEYRHSLKGHVYGIYSLDWSDSTNALFSAGLDHDVYIWNPYVNRRIFVLKGHNHSLVGVKCVPGTPQVISADISGMFRIWDIRTFTTVQVFNCTMNEINCFTVTDQPKRIIAGGKRLHFFDYDEPTDHHLADDQGCIAVLYNKIFYTFITAHPKCIKVWDATNGKLLSVFRDLTTRDITCICMDHRERKVFVGDSKGRVFTINIKNGARMKKFRKHDQDTSCLYYWGDFNRLISCSWDGRVIIHDDSTSAQKGVLRNEFKQHKKSCNYLHFNLKETLLASSSDDRSIILTNLNSYRQEAVLTHHEAEVKVAIFLTDNQSDSQLDYMCLVSADLTGKLYFYAIVPSKIKNTLLTTVTDTIESDVGTPENFPVRAMSFDPQRMMLYTGDEMGYMHKWNCSQLLNKLKTCGTIRSTNKFSHFEFEKEDETFLTSMKEEEEKIKFSPEDIQKEERIKGHEDGITCVSFVSDPPCVCSCGFDCKVYIWDLNLKRMGSLIIKQDPHWKLKIDKSEREKNDRVESLKLYDEIEELDYHSWFKVPLHKKKSEELPLEELVKRRLDKYEKEKRFPELTQEEQMKEIYDDLPFHKASEREMYEDSSPEAPPERRLYDLKQSDKKMRVLSQDEMKAAHKLDAALAALSTKPPEKGFTHNMTTK